MYKKCFLIVILLFCFVFFTGNVFAESFTFDEMTSTAEDVASYTSNNSKVPKSVTINSKTVLSQNYLNMLTTAVVKLNDGTKSSTTVPNRAAAPKPQGTGKGTLTKAQYITMAKNINSFYSSNGRAPNFASSTVGDIRYESLIYGYSKILRDYKKNGALPASMSFSSITAISSSGVTVDTTPPTTSINLASGSYNSVKVITLTAKDNKDPSPKIYYSLNGGSTLSATNAVSLTLNQGTHTLKYYAKDNKGNTETTKTATYKIDLTAPTVSNNLPEGFYAFNTAVILTASDNMDTNPTLYYRINNNSWVSAAKTVTIKLAQGINSISYYAKDNVGNTGSTITTNYVPFDNEIIIAANSVKSYIETNHKLPDNVSLNGQSISTSKFLKVLVEAVLGVDEISGFSIVPTDGISNPLLNLSEKLNYGNFSGGEYVQIARYIKNFTDTEGYCPETVVTSLGEINFESLVYLYSKLMVTYKSSDNSLVDYVEVIPWLAVTNPNKIYNFNSQKVFDTLQSAIDDFDTLEYDVIILGKNTQENVLLNKPLQIGIFSGKNITISGLNYNLPILTVTPEANGSVISGITFNGSATGILVNNTIDIKIVANTITNCENGIYLLNSYNISVIGNEILKNSINGILADNGTTYIFANNNIYNNTETGLNINNIINCSVLTNSFKNNQYGIKMFNCSGDINFNQITNNTQGLLVNGNSDVNSTNNWWGVNNPNLNGSDIVVMDNSSVICDRWLVLSYNQAVPDLSDRTGSTYNQNVDVNLIYNNMGEDTSNEGNVPNGFAINFFNSLTNANVNTTLSGGRTSVILKSSKSGVNPITISLDSQNTVYNLNFPSITTCTVINSRTGTGYQTIQTAIDSAGAGDTILLSDGIYTENILINKKITLKATNSGKTILKPGDAETGIITIINSGSGSTIQDLIFTDSEGSYGIGLNNVSSVIIKSNIIKDCGCGIYLYNSTNNLMHNNTIKNNNEGILFHNSSSTTIYNNVTYNIIEVNQVAISSSNSNMVIISNNYVKDNWEGIYIKNSTYFQIMNNTISDQGWSGIYIISSNSITIDSNGVFNNTVGIMYYDSLNVIFNSNLVLDNYLADISEVNSTDIIMASSIYTCGPASLSTLLKQFGFNITEDELTTLANTSFDGTSLKGLLDAAKSKGLYAKAVRIDFDYLKSGYIVLIKNNNTDTMHYTIIRNITNTTVYLADSSLGNFEMSIEKFKELFTGYALIVSETPIVLEGNTTELSMGDAAKIKGMVAYRTIWRLNVTKAKWEYKTYTITKKITIPYIVWVKSIKTIRLGPFVIRYACVYPQIRYRYVSARVTIKYWKYIPPKIKRVPVTVMVYTKDDVVANKKYDNAMKGVAVSVATAVGAGITIVGTGGFGAPAIGTAIMAGAVALDKSDDWAYASHYWQHTDYTHWSDIYGARID